RSGRFAQADRPWRAPRPKRGQVATSVRVVRFLRFAPSGAPPPFFIRRRNSRGFCSCCKTRARSAPRERGRSHLPPPRSGGGAPPETGEGGGGVGGGAQASTCRWRCRTISVG